MPSSKSKKIAYQEFGAIDNSAALARKPFDLPPQQQNLRIQVSRKGRKGKTVTAITGWQMSEEKLQQILKDLKTRCGTGGTVKDETLEIQGDHGAKLLEILVKLGYKAKISGGSK